ncbi:MAG TPA: O-antigen ligase family protein [Gaiellaceae bacterium]|nr:O-antigen ligase family protein [Gaiellaceae bacterium]
MRGVLRRAAAAGPGVLATPSALLPLVALVPLALAVFFGGGSDLATVAWIALVALAAVVVLAAAGLLGKVATPRLGADAWLLLAGLSGLVAWQGLSIVWSIQGDRTWETFNRGLAYLAFLALGLLATAAAPSARAVAAGLAVLLGTAVAWSLVTVAVPALGPDTERSARLVSPVGYWNALALLVAMSLPLWLWVAARGAHDPGVRAAATAMLFLALVALGLTTSRGGILAALMAVGIWLVVGRPRLESVAALAVAGVPAVALAGWALEATVLGEAGAAADARRTDGALFGLLAVVGVSLVVVTTLRLVRLPVVGPVRRRAGLGVLGAGAAAALVTVVLVLATSDLARAWDEFRNPPAVEVTNAPGRVTELSSNHRWTWWSQAWELFRADPWGGTGAGSYELARRPIREDTRAPIDPHNLVLGALSETGVVGLGLLCVAGAGAAWVAVAALRRLREDERAAAAALAAGAGAWLVHALVDMPWQYVAVTAPMFFALGALTTAGRTEPARRRRLRLAALAAAATILGAAFSIASPALAERRSQAAFDALVEGDPGTAVDRAEQALALDPLDVRAVLVRASAEEIRGNLDEAERQFRHAVELQPRNPETWYELGRFEFEARRRPRSALVYADRSYALDSWPPETGALLNEIRAELARRSR